MQDYQSSARTSDYSDRVKLMTVIPSEFSKVCWFEERLLPAHINEYLNALSEYNAGVILSSSFRDKYGLELGDTVNCSWGSNESFEVTVLAFVDYWPAMNPYETDENGNYKDFAVMNFDYVRVQTAVEPYQVWIDLDDSVTTEEFYRSIEDSKITPTMLNVKSQEIISEKNRPYASGNERSAHPRIYNNYDNVHYRLPYLLDTLYKEPYSPVRNP